MPGGDGRGPRNSNRRAGLKNGNFSGRFSGRNGINGGFFCRRSDGFNRENEGSYEENVIETLKRRAEIIGKSLDDINSKIMELESKQ